MVGRQPNKKIETAVRLLETSAWFGPMRTDLHLWVFSR